MDSNLFLQKYKPDSFIPFKPKPMEELKLPKKCKNLQCINSVYSIEHLNQSIKTFENYDKDDNNCGVLERFEKPKDNSFITEGYVVKGIHPQYGKFVAYFKPSIINFNDKYNMIYRIQGSLYNSSKDIPITPYIEIYADKNNISKIKFNTFTMK